MSKETGKKKTGKASVAKSKLRGDPIVQDTAVFPITITNHLSFKTYKAHKFIPHTVDCNKFELPAYRISKIENFLQRQECEYFISWSEVHGFEECKQAQTKEYAHRENGRIQIDDADLALQIFARLQPLLSRNVDGLEPRGCSSNIRFYRYTVGQRFGKHIDESHHDDSLGGVTKYTLLLYLNGAPSSSSSTTSGSARGVDADVAAPVSESLSNPEDYPCAETLAHCTGGQTVFYKGHRDQEVLLEVSPQQGMLLLHGHGSKCLTHEGREVTSGVKFLLRTDVVYG